MDIPKRKSIWDNVMTGIMIGFISPLVVSPMIAYAIMLKTGYKLGFGGFYDNLFENMTALSSLISLSGLTNLIWFFVFYRSKWDSTNKGMIMASMFYAVTVFTIKLM